ncbi:MAG: aldo/keto reductase [Paludisphaera borealis]|uniref:aldo/keto reductase n=1 Tax=Paludisphaera borealis TaxID=1387353 RepID=UPI0028509998|nr:aldo/keto reductase [Paludisphaera borealis]MDR3623284.1 aldo/keto reductase [Paludisphaera borealis]
MIDPNSNPTRRDVLQAGATGIVAASLAGGAHAAQDVNSGGVPLRPLGKTGEKVSLLALGGYHASVPEEEKDALRLIQRAVDEGVTFLDNAWDYMDGKAEERMGKALAEGKLRAKVFLMTKCCGRTAKDAQSNLEESLKRLQTDHIDLWQFHEINYDNDPDLVFAQGGALEFALKAKEQGKVRFIGFTGHKHPEIHLKMLANPYDWATVQMPLNVMDGQFRSFQHQVLPLLNKRGIGSIGMKSLGGMGEIVKDGHVPVAEAIRYVLSLPISTLVSGIDSEAVLEQNLKIVRSFKPMSHDEMASLESKYLHVAGDGRFEKFKTTQTYDGPVHQRQHGFIA